MTINTANSGVSQRNSESPYIFHMSCWAHECTLLFALENYKDFGFQGVEGPWPEDNKQAQQCASILSTHRIPYIAEICTGGGYVPDRSLAPEYHISELQQKLQAIPSGLYQKVNCLFGADNWSLELCIRVFQQVLSNLPNHASALYFETHRSRCLYNPWDTQRILKAVPALQLTLDISHWFAVCEGLTNDDLNKLSMLWPAIGHIHARIGYDQGPQIPSFEHGPYLAFIEQHLAVWQRVINNKTDLTAELTFTPEFGPDGYDYRNASGRESLTDLPKLNRQIRELCQRTLKFSD